MLRILRVLLFNWPKKVKLQSLTINETFLFENGFLIVHWRAKNCLWVKVNEIKTTKNTILLDNAQEQIISLKFVGLFNSTIKDYQIQPKSSIVSEKFVAPSLQQSYYPETLLPTLVMVHINKPLPEIKEPQMEPLKINSIKTIPFKIEDYD